MAMSITNKASFLRAHDAYYRIPDERDYDEYQCEECSGSGKDEPDEDTGLVTKCSSCKGTGHMSDEQIEKEEQDAKDYADECRFEAMRDER